MNPWGDTQLLAINYHHFTLKRTQKLGKWNYFLNYETIETEKRSIFQAVGDSALSTFAQNCANIERLNLQNCKKLSDRTCQSLSRHCPKLQVLDISSCSNLTDNSLRAIGHGCPMVSFELLQIFEL